MMAGGDEYSAYDPLPAGGNTATDSISWRMRKSSVYFYRPYPDELGPSEEIPTPLAEEHLLLLEEENDA